MKLSIYNMIIGRMLEAFLDKCIKDITSVSAICSDVSFILKSSVVKQKGWRSIYGEEKEEEIILPEWKEGDMLPIKACSIAESKTKPKPLHTEATLLAAMETAGKDTDDEELRQAMKECGIGTPATRASIIETLFQREYVVRQKKSLVPTEKGLALYSVVKDMRIANVEMTGEWELSLANIENGKIQAESFRDGIEAYTTQITTELLTCDKLFTHKGTECLCPKCKTGSMQFFSKVVRCDNLSCGFPVFRQIAGKTLTDQELLDLLSNGKTEVIKGFNSKLGKAFSAVVTFDEELKTKFVFPDTKINDKNKRKN